MNAAHIAARAAKRAAYQSKMLQAKMAKTTPTPTQPKTKIEKADATLRRRWEATAKALSNLEREIVLISSVSPEEGLNALAGAGDLFGAGAPKFLRRTATAVGVAVREGCDPLAALAGACALADKRAGEEVEDGQIMPYSVSLLPTDTFASVGRSRSGAILMPTDGPWVFAITVTSGPMGLADRGGASALARAVASGVELTPVNEDGEYLVSAMPRLKGAKHLSSAAEWAYMPTNEAWEGLVNYNRSMILSSLEYAAERPQLKAEAERARADVEARVIQPGDWAGLNGLVWDQFPVVVEDRRLRDAEDRLAGLDEVAEAARIYLAAEVEYDRTEAVLDSANATKHAAFEAYRLDATPENVEADNIAHRVLFDALSAHNAAREAHLEAWRRVESLLDYHRLNR